MAPTELIVQMQSIWCQDPIVAYTVHAFVPPIVVVAQVPKSSVVVVEAAAVAIDAAGAADTAAAADVVVDIDAPFEAADILPETDHGLAHCLSLRAYHVLL